MSTSRRFRNLPSGLESPYDYVDSVTPDNNTDLTRPSRSIRVAGAGTVSFINQYGVTCSAVFLAGEERPIRATRIRSTGTTATGIESCS